MGCGVVTAFKHTSLPYAFAIACKIAIFAKPQAIANAKNALVWHYACFNTTHVYAMRVDVDVVDVNVLGCRV